MFITPVKTRMFMTPELIHKQELYRAREIVKVAEAEGKNVSTTLRLYGVSSSIINELGIEVKEVVPKSKEKSKKSIIADWVKEHLGETINGGQTIAEATGVSYPLANNFIKERPDIFLKVKRGQYVIREVDKDRIDV